MRPSCLSTTCRTTCRTNLQIAFHRHRILRPIIRCRRFRDDSGAARASAIAENTFDVSPILSRFCPVFREISAPGFPANGNTCVRVHDKVTAEVLFSRGICRSTFSRTEVARGTPLNISVKEHPPYPIVTYETGIFPFFFFCRKAPPACPYQLLSPITSMNSDVELRLRFYSVVSFFFSVARGKCKNAYSERYRFIWRNRHFFDFPLFAILRIFLLVFSLEKYCHIASSRMKHRDHACRYGTFSLTLPA